MRRLTVHIAALFLVVVLSFAALVFTSPTSIGQSKHASKPSDSEAVRANALLRTDLNWTFGGKPQHGWYLYTLLIKRLIKTDHDPTSAQFASAVARWQDKSHLKPTGILDEETLYAMIARWQEARLKDRTP